MSEQTIQFPALTIAEANLVLEGLKQLPFGYVNDLFHKLRNEAVRQADGPSPTPELKVVGNEERAA